MILKDLIDAGKSPAEVAQVQEYLALPDVFSEFSARALLIPGHAGVAAMGVEFETDNPAEVARLQEQLDEAAANLAAG